MKRRAAIVGLGAVLVSSTRAIVPASDLQIFCGGTNAFVGEVREVRPLDCRLDQMREGRRVESCSLTNMLALRVKPTEELGRSPDAPLASQSTGELVSLYCHLNDALRITIPGNWVAYDFLKNSAELTQAQLDAALRGKQFIFSAFMTRASAVPNQPDFPKYYTSLWSLEKRSWVEETLVSSRPHGCDKMRKV
jgi:hypothetical protein